MHRVLLCIHYVYIHIHTYIHTYIHIHTLTILFLTVQTGPVLDDLILDPASPSTEEGEGGEEENWSYTTYILIYFFLTLAVIILVFGIVVVAMVAVWKANSRRRQSRKDTPLISEREMLDVMKKTGYVNPTYKFYSQS